MKVTNSDIFLLGRIKFTISRKAHIKSAPITIDRNHLRHIERMHGQELLSLNINAYDYVKLIVDNFDEIRQRPANAILLIKTNTIPPHDTCILELHYNEHQATWQVKTAQPRRTIDNAPLLWVKQKRGGQRPPLISEQTTARCLYR